MSDWNDALFASLANDPATIALTRAGAEEVLSEAIANAPVDTGDYRNSLHIEKVRRGDLTEFQIVSDDPAALRIESQSGNLSRAVSRARGG